MPKFAHQQVGEQESNRDLGSKAADSLPPHCSREAPGPCPPALPHPASASGRPRHGRATALGLPPDSPQHSVGALISPPPYTPGLMDLNWPETLGGPARPSSGILHGGERRAGDGSSPGGPTSAALPRSLIQSDGIPGKPVGGGSSRQAGLGSVQRRNEVTGLGPPPACQGLGGHSMLSTGHLGLHYYSGCLSIPSRLLWALAPLPYKRLPGSSFCLRP